MCFLQDYGDGGAYPEVHVAQYPLMMGKQQTSSNALTKTLDAEGKVRYDIIAKQGHVKDKVSGELLVLCGVYRWYMVSLCVGGAQ